MPIINKMLVIRPDYIDYDINKDGTLDFSVTRLISAWASLSLSTARNYGIEYRDLYKNNATRSNFEAQLNQFDPLFVFINGHGNKNLIVCQDGDLLLQGGLNTNILSRRVVYDLSCLAGAQLGPTAISEGCICFMGYTEEFIFYSSDLPPLADNVLRYFMDPVLTCVMSFLAGNSTSVSYTYAQERFDYWIEVLANSTDRDAPAHISTLLWDKDHHVLYGDGSATITGEIAPVVPIPPQPPTLATPPFPLKYVLVPLALMIGIPLLKKAKK